jgi:hypothetical protein
MTATLYFAGESPVTADKLRGPKIISGFASVPGQVPALLGCVPALVDVLATGHDYVVYSVFDSEGAVNISAMDAVSKLTGMSLNPDDEDMLLRGPVLVVRGL